MSGTGTLTRNAPDAAQAAARTERSSWLGRLRDEATSFVRGDNNAPWAILAETVIGCVPILGQLVDARDIIRGLIEVSGAPTSPLAWFNLITALIGVIPGGGDAVKRSLRAVKSGAVSVDELLAMIRRLHRGDPERLLREMLDVSKVRRMLNDILDDPTLRRNVSPEVRRSIDAIQANLNRQFDAFKREVDGWLTRGRRTSADAPAARAPAPGTPGTSPRSRTDTGSANRNAHSSSASPNTPNAATQRTARFRQLSNHVLGVLGEHMADYHCQDVKGWGEHAAHDRQLVNPAKLNDRSRLVNLWPPIPRGRGIDAVWRSNGAKPYAVIEAKASYDPTKTLSRLLGEAGDKTDTPSGGGGLRRRSGAGGQSGTGPAATRQTNGMVTQMSHGWIQQRVRSIALTDSRAKAELLRDRQRAYSRHVQFFSIPHAVSHAEALILLTAGRPIEHSFHASHQITREWGDNQIEQVVNNRAGIPVASRRRG